MSKLNNDSPEKSGPNSNNSGNDSSANAKNFAREAAENLVKKGVAEGGKSAATKALAGKVSGGATNAVASVGEDAKDAVSNLQKGDVVEAGSSAVRGGATLAANILGSPLLGQLVSGILKTQLGQKLTKSIVWIVIVTILLNIVILGLALTAISTAVAGIFNLQASRISCVDPDGGGIPVTDRDKLAVANTITQRAFELGLGRDAAVIGVMTALAESDLRNDVSDVLQPADTPRPFKSIGVFQQMPFYWANEFWPSGTQENSPAFNDSGYYFKAKQAILDIDYASGKFYEKFDTHPELKNGKWKSMLPWDVAQTIQVSAFNSGSNYAARLATAKSTVATIIASDPQAFSEPVYADDGEDSYTGYNSVYTADGSAASRNPCGSYGTYAGWAGYTLPGSADGSFQDGPIIYPNTEKAIARAKLYVGNAHLACSDGKCYRLCDHLAGDIWGYEDYSGYKSARTHWITALQTGVAAPGDRTPPIGALLFWDTGESGHVATYVGNGMVVSNMTGDKGANVYLVPASIFEDSWGAPYLGWADPIFRGGAPGSALENK